ncbi:unnamed protein product [Leuciscus chuanchicus]
MTGTMALELLQKLKSDDSDAGEQSEVESDSDDFLGAQSDSESESTSRKKRRLLSSDTADPDVPFMSDDLGDLRCPVLRCPPRPVVCAQPTLRAISARDGCGKGEGWDGVDGPSVN